jgi:hypothetical protein
MSGYCRHEEGGEARSRKRWAGTTQKKLLKLKPFAKRDSQRSLDFETVVFGPLGPSAGLTYGALKLLPGQTVSWHCATFL